MTWCMKNVFMCFDRHEFIEYASVILRERHIQDGTWCYQNTSALEDEADTIFQELYADLQDEALTEHSPMRKHLSSVGYSDANIAALVRDDDDDVCEAELLAQYRRMETNVSPLTPPLL